MFPRRTKNALTTIAALAGIVGAVFTVLEYTKASDSQGGSINQTVVVRAGGPIAGALEVAQNTGCSNMNVGPGATVNCNTGGSNISGQVGQGQGAVPAPGPGWRTRFGVPIPPCGPGQGYSLDEGRCMARQYIGGVIPCSQDDTTFAGGRYINNCQ
jgi:hypothetical protein